MIDVIIPTIGRPHRLAELVDNIHAVTAAPHTVTFVAEAHDADTIAAVASLDARCVVNRRTKNYAGALNTGHEDSDADWFFTGADDLVFHDGWDKYVIDGWFDVLGTNDLLNSAVLAGRHSTHSIVSRRYLETFGGVVDEGPGSFYPECYDHNYCDTEFIATAKARAKFLPCLDAIVEHMHVSTGKVEVDDTYLRSVAHYDDDARMYEMRVGLWALETR